LIIDGRFKFQSILEEPEMTNEETFGEIKANPRQFFPIFISGILGLVPQNPPRMRNDRLELWKLLTQQNVFELSIDYYYLLKQWLGNYEKLLAFFRKNRAQTVRKIILCRKH
jgi:hypothetical protein